MGVDVQYPWEASPRRYHDHFSRIHSFWIDQYPVTNAAFKKSMDATHYHPADGINFLKDWKAGTYPAGWGNKPVTWVSMEDARAYAEWAGKRLPHEWEWQYAAQGNDGWLYPWGNQWDAAVVPVPDRSRTLCGPDNVNAHPKGRSSVGVDDLVGAICGNGLMNSTTNIREPRFYEAEATINRRALSGIFPRPIAMMNMASSC